MSFSHIPEESLFLANEMNGQMPSVKWELASPQSLGALARKGPPGDHGALEAHGQDRVGRGVNRTGGSLAIPMVGSHGMGHRCPMAPSIFWGGLGSPLAGKTGPSLAVGRQDPSGRGETRGCSTLGPLQR